MSPETRDPEQLAEGTLISHLLELRDRLLRSMIAIAIAGYSAGAGRAVRASLRFAVPLMVTMILINVLVTHRGSTVLLRVDGEDEQASAGAVAALFERRFDEDS